MGRALARQDHLMLSFLVQGGIVDVAAGVVLIATVFAAVYHAEVVAHRTGEPFARGSSLSR